jgi:GT2 family glycosyltransferase
VLRLSIVIPVLGDQKLLDDTLVSVLENRPANCEILVVHNEPYNDPYELAGEVQFIEAPRRAGFAECVNIGLAASRAPVVHVLACGVEVRNGWANAAIRHFHDPEVAAVAPVVLHRDNPGAVLSAGLGYRPEGIAWRLGHGRTPEQTVAEPGDLCGADMKTAFYRRSAVQAVGGFSSASVETLSSVDMAMALDRAGYRCIVEPRSLAHTDAAATHDKPGFRHGRDAERLFWQWASAHGRTRSVIAHTALVAGECVLGFWRPCMLLHLIGRTLGIVCTIAGKRLSKPSGVVESDEPTIVTSPRFAEAACQDKESSIRAA